MSWKRTYKCVSCDYEVEVYDGRGLFRQSIVAVVCVDCCSVENIVVGGIVGDVAPSFRSEVGRLCPRCGSDRISKWDEKTCPRCGNTMEDTGKKEFWT